MDKMDKKEENKSVEELYRQIIALYDSTQKNGILSQDKMKIETGTKSKLLIPHVSDSSSDNKHFELFFNNLDKKIDREIDKLDNKIFEKVGVLDKRIDKINNLFITIIIAYVLALIALIGWYVNSLLK